MRINNNKTVGSDAVTLIGSLFCVAVYKKDPVTALFAALIAVAVLDDSSGDNNE